MALNLEKVKTALMPARVCRDCGHHWTPRGRDGGKRCTKCSSEKVRWDFIKPAIGLGIVALLVVGVCAVAGGFSDDCRVDPDRAANMRSGPEAGASVVRRIDGGSVVARLGTEGSWVRVRAAGGEEGWIHQSLLHCGGGTQAEAAEAEEPAPAPAKASASKSSRRSDGASRSSSRRSKSSSGGAPPAFSP